MVIIRHMTIYHQTMGINCLMNPFSPNSTSWHSIEHSIAPCSCNQVLAPLMFQRSGSPLQRCLGRDLWFMILGIPNQILNKGIRYRLRSTLTKGLDWRKGNPNSKGLILAAIHVCPFLKGHLGVKSWDQPINLIYETAVKKHKSFPSSWRFPMWIQDTASHQHGYPHHRTPWVGVRVAT